MTMEECRPNNIVSQERYTLYTLQLVPREVIEMAFAGILCDILAKDHV